VTIGFVRLVTHPAVLTVPLDPAAALDRVEAWFTRPCVQPLDPGPRHLIMPGTNPYSRPLKKAAAVE